MDDKIKQIIVVAVSLVGLLAVSLIYFNPFGVGSSQLDAYAAIPKSTALVVDVDDLSLLLDKADSLSYSAFCTKSSPYLKLKEEVSFLQSLSLSLSPGADMVHQNVLVGAAHVGGGEMGFLYVFDMPSNETFGIEDIKAPIEAQGNTLSTALFEGKTVFEIVLNNSTVSFDFVQYDNLLIASFQSTLVEEAITVLENESPVLPVAQLRDMRQTNTLADLYVIVNQQQIGTLAATLLKPDFAYTMQGINNLDWTFLTLKITEENILWNGESVYLQEEGVRFSQLKNDNQLPNEIVNNLPSNTAYFQSFLSEDTPFFEQTDLDKAYWHNWIDKQYGYFILETFDTDFQRKAGMAFLATDIDVAKANIAAFAPKLRAEEKYSGKEIFSLKTDFDAIFPHHIINWNEKIYVGFDEDMVWLANDISTIHTCMQKKQEGNVLSIQSSYQENMSQSNNGVSIVYCNPMKWKKSFGAMFAEVGFDLTTIKSFGQQITTANNRLKVLGSLGFGEATVSSAQELWSATLDTVAYFSPQVVVNHNDDSKELITQDAGGQVYLISASGEIVFKTQVDGAIRGEVFQVDYYKNGKLQYVFNTSHQIYIIDRNGNSVGDFPLNIPAEASASMLVVNYDNARNYRMFVPTVNERIYGYKIDGSPLTGWSPRADVGLIHTGMQHTMIDTKDYIYCHNVAGDFMAMARDGSFRIKENLGALFIGGFAALDDGFVNGAEGKVYKITLDGEVQSTQIDGEDYNMYQYVYSHENEVKASMFCNGESLQYAKTASNHFMSYSFDESISTIAAIDAPKTYFVAHTGAQVYAVDEKGGLHADFPMSTISIPLVAKLYEGKQPILILQNNEGVLKAVEIGW